MTWVMSTPGSYDFGFAHLANDAGVGLRLDLPIGPLQIDYGFPILKAIGLRGGKLQFSVGYQF